MARLTRDARQILGELELIMHGKAASWNSSGGKGENENPVPQGEANPPADHWRRIFLACAEHDLSALVEEARDELGRIRRRDPDTAVPEEGRDAWEERLIEEGEGYEARVVATSFSTSVQVVTRARKKHGRDPNNGLEVSTPEVRAAQLHKQGLNQGQIARALGVSQPTVSRLLA